LRAARAWSVRPTVLVEEWDERDRVLAEALIEYEANAFCPGCGQLKSKAWDEDTADSWQHETVKCSACAGHETLSKNEKEPEPGELKFLSLNEDDVRRAKARKNAPKIDLDAV
jgi:Zn ribbon nucleic-acid-binding protein